MNNSVGVLVGHTRTSNHFVSIVKKTNPGQEVVQVSYDKKVPLIKDHLFLKTTPKDGFKQALEFLKNKQVSWATSQADTGLLLLGKLVDHFSLTGPSYWAVKTCKNKWLFDQHLIKHGLEKYRPETQLLSWEQFQDLIAADSLPQMPFLIKPIVGAKSRGVFLINSKKDIIACQKYFQTYWKQIQFTSTAQKQAILIEEFLIGNQVTLTSWVDGKGQLQVLDFVDVLSGRDLGMNHFQLVLRHSPSVISDSIKASLSDVLQKLVTSLKLKNVLLHPDFMVTSKGVFIMELNIRIGGFRQKMTSLGFSRDLHRISIRLAENKSVRKISKIKQHVTAIEVWPTKSGKIKKIFIPKDPRIKKLKLKFKVGDFYISPPQANEPFAYYFMVSEDHSLADAKRVLDLFHVEIDSKVKS